MRESFTAKIETSFYDSVLRDELDEIECLRLKRMETPDAECPEADKETPPLRRRYQMNLIGLAFSGGGIRSATFNLGILQGLARYRLLHLFDYLSTVSGGGYIGSWLTAWASRKEEGIRAVQEELLTRDRVGSKNEEPRPIFFLRSYSNYLTPRLGMLSGDTWALISTYLRNLLLNLSVHFPLFLTVLLLPMVLVSFFGAWIDQPASPLVLLYLSVTTLGLGAFLVGMNLSPAIFSSSEKPWYSAPGYIASFIAGPICASALSVAIMLWASRQERIYFWPTLILAAAGIFVLALHLGFLGASRRGSVAADAGGSSFGLMGSMLLSAPFALALWVGLATLTGRLLATFSETADAWFVTALGMPVMLIVYMAVVTLQIGLLGRAFPEEQREWWSRLGGSFFIVAICWTGLFGAVLLGMPGLVWIKRVGLGLVSAGWVASTVSGILAGKSPKTGNKSGDRRLEIIAKIAPYVFIAGLLIFCSFLISIICFGHKGWKDYWSGIWDTGLGFYQLIDLNTAFLSEIGLSAYVSACLILLLGGLFLSRRIDINLFSLNLLYRNRLTRCYLGASNPSRNPQPFTGFDPTDNVKLNKLRAKESYCGPYHIINTALNLTGGSELAWQQRKAASFVFTPLYSGYELAIAKKKQAAGRTTFVGKPVGCYQRTADYAKGEGVQISEAMSISGAAASPNMGSHTSRAVAFLMNIFNVRLGWWYGNPADDEIWKVGKSPWGIKYLLAELFGMADAKSRYVYLSDGGHFENLGIYELVRRRCRVIVACDAGCDPDVKFEDLGNAIRKVRVDFGIPIEIDVSAIRKEGAGIRRCAVGKILYSEADGEGAKNGVLIYIKPLLNAKVPPPPDVMNYHSKHETFPHESTANQWFDEAQFESYRMLGQHTIKEMMGGEATGITILEFVRRAEHYSRQDNTNRGGTNG